MKIKAIDLFSGCGGVSCGLVNSGFKVTGAVEIDKNAARIYKNYHKLKDVNVIVDDIFNVKGFELLKNSNIKVDELYLLAGCPPCQNFSSQNRSGKLKSEAEKEALLMQYLRIIKEIHPPFILLENVAGIKSPCNLNILQKFINELQNEQSSDDKEKYHVISDILNAANYGVPQRRRRFVLHAVRQDMFELLKSNGIEVSLPKQTHNELGKNGLKKWISVWDVISDLPPIVAGEHFNSETIKNHSCANLSDINIERMKVIRENGGNRESLPESLKLKCHKNYSGHKDAYGIINPDLPAPTMTGGCLSYSKGRFGHPYQNRALSIREAARIQTFPDDFEFDDCTTKSALQIGNAVPVKLVEVSGKQILEEINICLKALNKKRSS